jgi:hypothetical protein
MVDQIKIVCEALNIIDRGNISLVSEESVLQKAEEYIDGNIQRIRKLRQSFGNIVLASPDELGTRFIKEVFVFGKQAGKLIDSMRSADLSKASETLQPLKAWHKISIERKRQILVFSYIIREDVNNFTDSDFAYAEDILCKIKDEIERF